MDNNLSLDFRGHRVLITGAAGGIGRSVAKLCAARGAKLLLCDIAPVEKIKSSNAHAHEVDCLSFDMSDRHAVEVHQNKLKMATAWIDTAGICPRDDWMHEDWDRAFDLVMNANIRGPINIARIVFPAMISREYGRIVLSGSLAGWTGGVRASPHYAAAKGGIHALVRWFAQRGAAHRVCVNGVAPGPVATDMTAGQGYVENDLPMKRLGEADEIAELITFLASPKSSYMNGTIVDINGSIHMR